MISRKKRKVKKLKLKKPKASKTYLRKKCDKVVGELCRAICKCEICGRTDSQLQWCHFISRGVIKLRYDRRNFACLCVGCHFRGHHHPAWFVAEWDKIKGSGMALQLEIESNKVEPIKIDFYLSLIHI